MERQMNRKDRMNGMRFSPQVTFLTSRLLMCTLFALRSVSAFAQGTAGDLDPTFGAGGKVTTDFAVGFSDLASAVVLQSDGKIVTAGGAGVDFGLARYNADGTLDTTFGVGGKVTTNFLGFDTAFALGQQSDRKLVAAGVANQGSGNANFALARYNADGSLDPGFGAGGKVITDFAGRDDFVFAIVPQPDGKIVVAGYTGFDVPPPFGISFNFALARYNEDGSLDASFGTGGKVATDFNSDSDRASAVLLQADGRLVAGGTSSNGGFPDFALARYNTDGTLDTTFGTGGKVKTDFAGSFDEIVDLQQQPDGKLVAAGTSSSLSTGFDFAVARYNPDGSLDGTFGVGGKTTTDAGGQEYASGLAQQSNGKLVLVGQVAGDFGVVRYNSDATVDASFGTNGIVTTNFTGFTGAFDVAVQPDGYIIVAGTGDGDFALARYVGDATVTSISLDIRPGSSVNPINLSSSGVIPVAILSTETFDATTVAPSTVCFGDADAPAERDCTEADGVGHVADVNGDNLLDLVLHFDTIETGIDAGDPRACLSGMTFDGLSVEGCDAVITR
jgi:uncharacterized delta-60 repeat protein